MELSNYAKKKQDKANLISEATNLLKTSGLSQTARNKMELKIKSNHAAKIKSVIDELKLTQNLDKTKKTRVSASYAYHFNFHNLL